MPKFLRRPADRPVEILAAALNCFAERGFAATTMAEIAAAAGVTAGTIYRYFPSKEALVEALVESGGDASWNRGREVAEAYRSRTAREVVALLLERWAAHLEADQAAALLRVMAREGAGFPETTTKYGTQLLDSGRLAIERALRHGIDVHGLDAMVAMARDWPFFAAMIDDVEMAMAKSDIDIFERYSALAGGLHPVFFPPIAGEFDRTREAILAIKQRDALLADDYRLRLSIRLRNPY
ncbi:MAG TPA: phosphoenolpyruvate carboxylase, partial [Gemmatimonadales bacterium]|nr:phosphoenolpyruvate carboxylase [Gemmatimonadales bacterium]